MKAKTLKGDIAEIVATIAFPFVMAFFIWVFLCATPDQKYSDEDNTTTEERN